VTLKEARILYSKCLCHLVLWANSEPGWEVALGVDFDEADPKEKRRHMRGSLHYLGLANDLALYINGAYQTDTEAYAKLGQKWKSLHPELRWGGDFKKKDGNHFSLTYGGKA
jgi:hypothetical protein